MNERPIPEAALRDKNAVEMLRVWDYEDYGDSASI